MIVDAVRYSGKDFFGILQHLSSCLERRMMSWSEKYSSSRMYTTGFLDCTV